MQYPTEPFSLGPSLATALPGAMADNAPGSGKSSAPLQRYSQRRLRVRLPQPKEYEEEYSRVTQNLAAALRDNVVRSIANPIAIILRESDPEDATTALAALENKYYHPDTDDDTMFQVVVDVAGPAGEIATLYVLPESHLPRLAPELATFRLELVSGALVYPSDTKGAAYDPSALIKSKLGLDTEGRFYTIGRPRKQQRGA